LLIKYLDNKQTKQSQHEYLLSWRYYVSITIPYRS